MGLHAGDSFVPSARGAGWRLALYPEAAEGGGSFRYSLPRSGGGSGAPGGDPERAAAEAARRARGQVRRYCAANRLNRLGTLTYAGVGCHDPRRLRADLAEFFRSLRGLLDGEAFPYVWVPEWHKSGHGLHAHFAVGRFVPRGLIERAWGRGFVHVTLLGDLPVGSGTLAEARLAARYLAKYVGKDLGGGAGRRPKGLHRYEVAQGFLPQPVALYGRTVDAVLHEASERMRGRPTRLWQSREVDDWQGPPAVWAQWA